jgi:hypothetical protein
MATHYVRRAIEDIADKDVCCVVCFTLPVRRRMFLGRSGGYQSATNGYASSYFTP